MNIKDTSIKRIFIMSIPIFLELFLQMLVGNIDQIMLSQFSDSAVASIVNGNQVMNLVLIILSMTAGAQLIIFTHMIGAKEDGKLNQYFFASMLLICSFAILISLVLIIFGKNILTLLNAPLDAIEGAYKYIVILAIGLIFQAIFLVCTSTLRSFSKLKKVLICAVVMNILNIIGNYMLINGILIFPRLGVVGAAISTVISRFVGMSLSILMLIKETKIRFEFKWFLKMPWQAMKKVMLLAIPTGTESISYNLSQMLVLGFINVLGTSVVATKGYCAIIAQFTYIYTVALAQATQIILGYLVGEKRYGELQKKVNITMIICVIISISIAIICYIFSDNILSLFSKDPAVWELGKRVLFVEIFLEFGRTVNIVMSKCLATLKDVNFFVIVGVTSQWVVAIGGLLIISSIFGMSLVVIWIAAALDECTRGLIFQVRLNKKVWLKNFQ